MKREACLVCYKAEVFTKMVTQNQMCNHSRTQSQRRKALKFVGRVMLVPSHALASVVTLAFILNCVIKSLLDTSKPGIYYNFKFTLLFIW